MNLRFDLPKTALVRAINHVLEREEWALRDLSNHQGRVIELILPIGSMQWQIQDNSFIALLSEVHPHPDLVLEVDANSFLALSAPQGTIKDRAMRAVKITGDAQLAQLIAKLSNQLRWEYEEDLAKMIGDAPAHFICKQAKRFAQATEKAILDLQGNMVEYLSEEKKVLLHQRDFVSHKMQIQAVRDAVERLEKRISFLQKSRD
ncbi:ubiquinone biosynthesis accessory factor UbiJ [Polynucleobacter acidiphobus]|uniref:ubiquinone biosynthesis accessory factor UbiJ n=1 Tax=Polynucleobacter acidiphobus TaxID=556053 RepID=UPI000D348654|nr:SCP2 sterol-binding domain-containing protein [Polynucleobacter acidiphobus]